MKKYYIFILTAVVFSSFLLFSGASADIASDVGSQLGAAGGEEGAGVSGSARHPGFIVAQIIRVTLELLGIIFFGLTIYAGYLWMTAAGNDEQVSKAKSLLYQATVGLIIILSSYSITIFATKLALGDWTDYTGYSIERPPQRIRCGVEYGTQCPLPENF